MKRSLLLLIIITGLVSCNSNTGSPTSAVDGMFTAMKTGNIAEMKKFISKQDVDLMETAEKLANSVAPGAIKKVEDDMTAEFKEKVKDISYKLKNEKINGDNASVEAEITKDGKTDSHNFELVKEEGAWKIALTKSGDGMFNSMKGNMGPGGEDLKEGMDKLQNMNPDSLKELVNKGLQAYDSIKKKMKKN